MDQLWFLSKPSDRQMDFQVQLLQIHARQIAHLHMLQMMPSTCIPRVQVGSIAWQHFHMNPLRSAAGQPFSHSFPSMNWGAVPNDQQFCSRLAKQMFEKHHAVRTRQRLWSNQGIHLACWCEGSHHRQMISGQPLVDYRRFPFRSVGLDLPRQQIKTRFVDKNQGSALTHCFPPQLGPILNPPALNGYLVPLHRSGNGDLRCPAQFLHQARNVVLVIRNPQFPPNNLGNARTGPNVSSKTIGLRSVPQKLRHHYQLFWSQFWRVSSPCMTQQSLNPTCFSNRQPSADCSLVDTKCLGDEDFRPSLLMQGHSPKPTPFADFPNKLMLSHPLMVKKVAQIAQLSVIVIWSRKTVLSHCVVRAWAGTPGYGDRPSRMSGRSSVLTGRCLNR